VENVEVTPEVAVVVSTHDRPGRLRRLFDALAEQTIGTDRFEIVVCHDSNGPETEELLRTHPLAAAGTLRHLTLEPDSAWPGHKRNRAWRESRAPLVAFTDDDCRPPADWLERVLEACAANPGAIVQGATRPDPEEAEILYERWRHYQAIEPPTPWAETCNIAYPRELLERLDGFLDDAHTGEDTDLAWRAMELGTPLVGAPEVLTYHCVEAGTFKGAVRAPRRWDDLPRHVKRHPGLRRHYLARIFWKDEHAFLPLALVGLALERRSRLALLLCLPYAIVALPQHRGHDPRSRLQTLSELPGVAAVHLAEMAVLARGSVKYRSLLL
jgi:glycosyltransferase involved in cell wall biosynthesis